MAARKLKDVSPPPAAAESPPLAAPQPRLTPKALRDIAGRADPTQPPAVMPVRQGSTLLTLRIQTSLANAIADAAARKGRPRR